MLSIGIIALEEVFDKHKVELDMLLESVELARAPVGESVDTTAGVEELLDSIDEWRLYMSCLKKAKLCIDVSHAELWDYDPVESIVDFYSQLNYVHLQDYSSCTVREQGRYNPVWVDVGAAECLDFKDVLDTLTDKGFSRWVTACPQAPPEGGMEASQSAHDSASMRQYIRGLGY